MGIAAARPATRTRRAACRCANIFRLFANLRPSVCYPSLTHASPLRAGHRGGRLRRVVRARTDRRPVLRPAQVHRCRCRRSRRGRYDDLQAQRDRARHAPGVRGGPRAGRKLTSVDKANVLENSVLWRRTVVEIGRDFPTWNSPTSTWTTRRCNSSAARAIST